MIPRPSLLHLALLCLMALAGCSGQSSVQFGTVRMRLIDAPAALQAVHIVVTEVSIHQSDGLANTNVTSGSSSAAGPDVAGWEVLTDVPTTYDLLALRGGAFATLAEALVPAGTYTQIRLSIGEGSNVVVDGVSYPLVVPSGAQSGLKLIHTFTVAPGGTSELTLDFDAAKSVFGTVGGTWHLKPTVSVTSTTAGGSLGTINPAGTVRY